MKSLTAKLDAIHADPGGAGAFILADAKDADMAAGLAATGRDPVTGNARSLADYRDQMREIVGQGLVDIMLMSTSSCELLAAEERLFDGSPVTAAVRANDTSDIHLLGAGGYGRSPSLPFRTTTIGQIKEAGSDLALYSLTPAGESASDVRTLEAYRDFRIEAHQHGLRHFLEVFDPLPGAEVEDVGRFVNDFVVRTLAGVPKASRPVFLKMAYHGPRAMEELVAYDPHLVPGVLGGSAGTTGDAFSLLESARRHGARAALFGRKINASEHQLMFVAHLRAIADGALGAEEACRSYHAELARLGLRPHRPLADDLQVSQRWE